MKTSLAGAVNIVLVAVISKSGDMELLLPELRGRSGSRERSAHGNQKPEINQKSELADQCWPAGEAGQQPGALGHSRNRQIRQQQRGNPGHTGELSTPCPAPPAPRTTPGSCKARAGGQRVSTRGWHWHKQILEQAPEERRFRTEKWHLQEKASYWTPTIRICFNFTPVPTGSSVNQLPPPCFAFPLFFSDIFSKYRMLYKETGALLELIITSKITILP